MGGRVSGRSACDRGLWVEREVQADEHGLLFAAIFLLLINIFFNIAAKLVVKYITAEVFELPHQYNILFYLRVFALLPLKILQKISNNALI